MPEQVLELNDMQALILSGHKHLLSSTYLLLRVVDASRAGTWLTSLAITTARRREKSAAEPDTAIQVAFTCHGLSALGIQGADLQTFPTEFREGMARDYRSLILGDTEESAPDKWTWGGRNSPEVHILLLVYGKDRGKVNGICGPLPATLIPPGLELVAREDSEDRPDGTEPFGFHDGIAQPCVEGGHFKPTCGEPLIRAGEFVLGYLNQYDKLPDSPTASGSGKPFDLGKNGTYLVFRKLAQNVEGFKKFVSEASQRVTVPTGVLAEEWLGAKMVGRWKSGAPLVLSPNNDDTALGGNELLRDDFLYHDTDLDGLACPKGSHVRRTNPRDSLLPTPTESLTMVARHRIVRRGRPYLHVTEEEGIEQGLFFIALNVNIQRQFEFIQQTWVNNPKFDGLYDNKDPILGDNKPPKPTDPYDNCTMNIPGAPVRQRVHDLPRFVQVKAGAYFFLPGIRTLGYLADACGTGLQGGTPTSSQAPAEKGGNIPGSPAIGFASAGPVMMAENRLRDLWHAALVERDVIAVDFANLKQLVAEKFTAFLTNPVTLRELFAALRTVMPVLVTPGFAVVTKYADVVEVLRDDVDFGVTEIYATKMQATSGAFFLGMENTEQYQRESAICRQAVRAADLDRVRALVTNTSDELIRAVAPSGRLDAVGGFSRLVPARVVSEYFGVPGPDLATQLRWMRTIFWEIFVDFGNDAPVRDSAAASSREMSAYLTQLITLRRNEIAAGGATGDEVLTRLVRMQSDPATRLDDDGIRRNIGGIVVGAVDTTSKAVANAVDQLLDRPQALAAAQQAARAGDDALVAAHVFEALRFNPQNPFLLRHCRSAHVVGKGTASEKQIPAGVTVLAATLSAMFDPSVVAAPDEFRAGRPPENYLHFGAGMHTCFGEHINRVQIPAMVKSLLRLKNLRRAPGADGKMVSEGPFPDHLVVLFDPD